MQWNQALLSQKWGKRFHLIKQYWVSLAVLPSSVILAWVSLSVPPKPAEASITPKMTQIEVEWQEQVVGLVTIPDWSQLSLSDLPGIVQSGSIGSDGNEAVGYNLSRTWQVGDTPDLENQGRSDRSNFEGKQWISGKYQLVNGGSGFYFRLKTFCGASSYFIGPFPYLSLRRNDWIFLGEL